MGQNTTQIYLVFLYWSGTYTLLAPIVGYIGDKTVSFRFSIATINFASGSDIITISKSTVQEISSKRQAITIKGY